MINIPTHKIYLSLSKIEKRHNSRLLIVLGVSLEDLMHLLVILSGEIERSVDIVVRLIIVLEKHHKKKEPSYLLSEAKVEVSHCRLDYYHQPGVSYHRSELSRSRQASRRSRNSTEHPLICIS